MYQLQKIVPPKIAESENDNFTVLTLDYTLDGDEARQITRDDINIFHHRRKLTLAYLSVGEAEMYRYYFRKVCLQIISPSPCVEKAENEEGFPPDD